jgi:DNA-binding CsgD family transcriptional regulator
MLVADTQMHVITFGFICLELAILFYLVIYRLGRPDDKEAFLDIVLIILLIIYNITGGLLPDPHMPGSYFVQECIAYGTGFITPCYFPYYVYKGFRLEKMKFHAYRGVYFFLVAPYLLFALVFLVSRQLDAAKNILFVPVLYALWVLFSVWKAIRYKYRYDANDKKLTEEVAVLFLSLTPWVGLPIIAYFDFSQAAEAITTNSGFLLLLAFHIKRNVQQMRAEHQRLIESESSLKNWNERLQQEVDKRTKELEKLNAGERFSKNCELYGLTSREKEIARLICQGLGNKHIAEVLFISEKTAAKHIQNIFEKVNVGNRMELCKKLGVQIGL